MIDIFEINKWYSEVLSWLSKLSTVYKGQSHKNQSTKHIPMNLLSWFVVPHLFSIQSYRNFLNKRTECLLSFFTNKAGRLLEGDL